MFNSQEKMPMNYKQTLMFEHFAARNSLLHETTMCRLADSDRHEFEGQTGFALTNRKIRTIHRESRP